MLEGIQGLLLPGAVAIEVQAHTGMLAIGGNQDLSNPCDIDAGIRQFVAR